MNKKSIARNRALAYESQSHRCFYCSVQMWARDSVAFALAIGAKGFSVADLQCTAEHALPRCNGGKHHRKNILAACRRCNRLRHARKTPLPVAAYKAHVQARVAAGRWHPKWVFSLGLCL